MTTGGDGEPGHPLVRRWVRAHPGVRFTQQATDPEVHALVADLGLGEVERDLGGADSLTVLVDHGRHVVRTYKPFVTRRRIEEVQRVRAAVGEAGLVTPVPVSIQGSSIHRCGWRWAEVEPHLSLPTVRQGGPVDLFRGLGRLHRVLAKLPDLQTTDVRRSLVSVDALREWTALNVADGFTSSAQASDLRRLLALIEQRWVSPGRLPTQIIHADPHAGNIIADTDGDPVYLDFGGLEVAPRVHDIAMAVTYQLAAPGADLEHVGSVLPGWLDAYAELAETKLSVAERDALPPYAAAIAAYYDLCGWGTDWRLLAPALLSLPAGG